MSLQSNPHIRNIAIIAHVDHGKTTLVDALFKGVGMFRVGQQVDDRVMDSMDLEKERGITISAKNCAVEWQGVKINILDTPGHSDFGGEVERALSMADGCVLLVDASEGPLPQTRFVLQQALGAGLNIIVVINKIDRSDARPQEVLNSVYDLFIDLGATEAQLGFPVLYAIGRDGVASVSLAEKGVDMDPLFKAIIALPGPLHDPAEPFQMVVADLAYSEYLGRLAIGRVKHGILKSTDNLVIIPADGKERNIKINKLQSYTGLTLKETATAEVGDIIALAGIDNVTIGDSICTKENIRRLPRIKVEEPTVAINFRINDSPLVGQEGKIVQSRQIWERLKLEALKNVSILVELSEENECFVVKGRGELQIAILIEQMRREGFELSVSRPQVILKEENGKKLEPIENLMVDCDECFVGIVTEKLSLRKGRMLSLVNNDSGRARIMFSIPSRGLIGFRDEFLTDTKGTGIMNSSLEGYAEFRGEFPNRFTGSLVADRAGKAVAYGLFNLEPRGILFVVHNDPVYEGMVIGEHNRENDIDVNPTKEKKLTNLRSAGKDEHIILAPVKAITLEWALHFIADDELAEVTPKSIRLRKAVLSAQLRHQIAGKKKLGKA